MQLMSSLMKWLSLVRSREFWCSITLKSILSVIYTYHWTPNTWSSQKAKKSRKWRAKNLETRWRTSRWGWTRSLLKGWGSLTRLMRIEILVAQVRARQGLAWQRKRVIKAFHYYTQFGNVLATWSLWHISINFFT